MGGKDWLLVAGILLVSSIAPLSAEQQCVPKEAGAKILRTPNIADMHPDWMPPAAVGTSWSLARVKRERSFLSGTLVSPRGGVQPGRVFVLPNEWNCR
jgi:hypothetical protein